MKIIFTYLAIIMVFVLSAFSFGIDDVVSAFKTGNASAVARYFDNTVEIALPEKSNTYSRSQAEIILRDFFNTHSVRGFDLIHKGENSGSQYFIGTLLTRTTSFRTTIFMKLKGDRQIVQEIRFENR